MLGYRQLIGLSSLLPLILLSSCCKQTLVSQITGKNLEPMKALNKQAHAQPILHNVKVTALFNVPDVPRQALGSIEFVGEKYSARVSLRTLIREEGVKLKPDYYHIKGHLITDEGIVYLLHWGQSIDLKQKVKRVYNIIYSLSN